MKQNRVKEGKEILLISGFKLHVTQSLVGATLSSPPAGTFFKAPRHASMYLYFQILKLTQKESLGLENFSSFSPFLFHVICPKL